ncbi:hypothetical protein ACIPSA_41390 [Streptomyces sp. NPDC086549]|uniref:hypothetical protein n=1 Tax=Streptomyces sp. NPDC086549 TaxID=3365752 RepID=UPI00381933AB
MKHSRTAAGLAAAALATGLVLGGAETAAASQTAPQRITDRQQLAESLRQAVALERTGGDAQLSAQGRGVLAITDALPC